jgi:spermidine/putrescine transport system permease protein
MTIAQSETSATAPSVPRGVTDRNGPSAWRRLIRRPVFLAIFAAAYFVWSLGPVLAAIFMSFNEGRSRSQFSGLSLHWWLGEPFGNPTGSLFTDPVMLQAIGQTFILAIGTVLIAVPIGAAAGIGLHRWRGPIAEGVNGFLLATFVLPELVLAVAMLSLLGHLFTFIPLGTGAQLVGLISLQICIPALLVRTQYASLPRNLEEAAMDLGASSIGTLFRVVLPNLAPSIIVSTALVFANVVDNFVTVSYLSGSSETQPLSVKLYSSARALPTPELNAAVTLLLVLTLVVLAASLLIAKRLTRTGELASTLGRL